MPTPSVCARHSSYLHVLNADTSHQNDNRLAVADHMPDDRLNLILSFETNCCPVRQTRVRLAYTKTVSCLHVRPMSHRAVAWSLEQTPLGGNHRIFLFPFAKCFVLGFGWNGHSLCAQVAKTFAVNNVVLLSPQSEKHRKITILKSLGKKPTMTIADHKEKSR